MLTPCNSCAEAAANKSGINLAILRQVGIEKYKVVTVVSPVAKELLGPACWSSHQLGFSPPITSQLLLLAKRITRHLLPYKHPAGNIKFCDQKSRYISPSIRGVNKYEIQIYAALFDIMVGGCQWPGRLSVL